MDVLDCCCSVFKCRIDELGISNELLAQMTEYGIIELEEDGISHEYVLRLRRAIKIQTLGVNLAGVAIILDLLERIVSLEHEIDRMKEIR